MTARRRGRTATREIEPDPAYNAEANRELFRLLEAHDKAVRAHTGPGVFQDDPWEFLRWRIQFGIQPPTVDELREAVRSQAVPADLEAYVNGRLTEKRGRGRPKKAMPIPSHETMVRDRRLHAAVKEILRKDSSLSRTDAIAKVAEREGLPPKDVRARINARDRDARALAFEVRLIQAALHLKRDEAKKRSGKPQRGTKREEMGEPRRIALDIVAKRLGLSPQTVRNIIEAKDVARYVPKVFQIKAGLRRAIEQGWGRLTERGFERAGDARRKSGHS